MDQNIIMLYQLDFQNSIFNILGFPAKIDKRLITINDKLTEFINGWNNVQDINEDLMPDILNVLNDNSLEEFTQSETVGVKLTKSRVKLYGLYNEASSLNPDFVFPTQDFKEIIEGWRDFLLTPPLNGTNI